MFLTFLTLVFALALEVAAWGVPKAAFSEHGWERQWVAPRDGPIKLHIALRQADGGAQIEKKLMAVSDPNSGAFREFMSPDHVPYLSHPAQGTVHAIEFWLWQYGLLRSAVLTGGVFEIDTTIRQAERLLNTTYFMWSDGTTEIVRTELFHIPDYVSGHIDFISPTTSFPRRAKLNSVASLPTGTPRTRKVEQQGMLQERASCGANDYVTPSCVREVYDINYHAEPNRTTFAVYGTEAASFSSSDLRTYLDRYRPPAASAHASYTVVGNGDPKEGSGGIEAKFETALDTQVLMGIAWPAAGVLYNNGGVFGPSAGSTYDRFVQFLQELITNKTVPSVVSFSESMPENQMDPQYAKRLCNMMAQVGARGVTLLFSSGDNGPNGDTPTGTHKDIFEPEFPASCPWVTAVGGTTNLADETAATKSTISGISKLGYTASGGGFSNLFPIPKYQSDAVENYTVKHIPERYTTIPGFNEFGRGIPDVSAFSTNFPTVVSSVTFGIGGTSSSTPLWAGIIALLNDYQASKGRPNLGFVNPWLYSLTEGLKDITTGGNSAGSCNVLGGCHLSETLGYNVTKGWDPVTGLGSPIFSKLAQILDDQS